MGEKKVDSENKVTINILEEAYQLNFNSHYADVVEFSSTIWNLSSELLRNS
jgi:hypothetical protein